LLAIESPLATPNRAVKAADGVTVDWQRVAARYAAAVGGGA
jgi:hypothetical protein